MRIILAILAVGLLIDARSARAEGRDPWDRVPGLLARIQAPAFPARDFRITDHGAVGNGAADCTAAFRRAIARCAAAGGGRVVVPPGRYLTGAIHLRSGVNLHIERGATICFYRDPARFLPPVLTRYEGNDLRNYSPFIYALDQENVAITGSGIVDGQGDTPVWKRMDRETRDQELLRSMAEAGVPADKRVFGAGHALRPNLVQFYRCRRVLVEGVTLRNGAMWTLHPVLSEDVTIRGITVESEVPNGDGIDPESCRRVLMENCSLATRDDAIAIKSGRNADGRRLGRPSEDVVVRNCRILPARRARSGIAIGSEVSGGARNIFIENTSIAGRIRGISLKTNSRRGGVISGVYLRNVEFRDLSGAVLSVDMNYGSERGGHPPRIQDVELRGGRGKNAQALWELDVPNPRSLSALRVVDSDFSGIRAATDAHGGLAGASLVNSTIDGAAAEVGQAPLRAHVRNLLQDRTMACLVALLLAGLLAGYWRLRRKPVAVPG